jgi:hypothetical protein
MKNYFIMLSALFFMAITVNAQPVNLGVKAGLNVYNMDSDNGQTMDSKVGFNAGLLGHIHLNPNWAIQPELIYSRQGTDMIDLDYINVPVSLQYMFENGFRIQAGPQIGFLVGATTDQEGVEMDIKDDMKPIDVGLNVGASYVHQTSGFGVDARYNIGLTDISESSLVNTTNRGLQVGVFYLFNHR